MSKQWRIACICIFLVVLFELLLMRSTVASMVTIWWRSETFNHCLFVVPIFMWLVWRKRHELSVAVPSPEARWLLLLLPLGFLWLVGSVVGIQVVSQLALVLIVCLSIWSILGTPTARLILFPITFLLFAAPFGDELLPVMMDFTADFTVWAIGSLGIPVYREGLYFSLPTGNWSVVEACSGIRYLIASVVLGSLFAYLTFTSVWKRVVFMLFAIVIPIIANGLRAVMIVLLGHFSDMTVATGVDHLVYGWLFFGVVMFLLFVVGHWMQSGDAFPQPATAEQMAVQMRVKQSVSQSINASANIVPRFARHGLLLLAMAFGWTAYAAAVNQTSTENKIETSQKLPMLALPGWQPSNLEVGWEPRYRGFDYQLTQAYEDNSKQKVLLNLLIYKHQAQGKELISSRNVLVPSQHEIWRVQQINRRSVTVANTPIDLQQARLSSMGQELQVWRWNRIGDANTQNKVKGKLLELQQKLSLKGATSAAVIIAVDASVSDPEKLLREFTADLLPELQNYLDSM